MRTLRRTARFATLGRVLLAADLGRVLLRHVGLLSPQERRRLARLAGRGIARRGRLGAGERRELRVLIAKLRLRMMLGTAVKRISPVPLPKRLLFGPRKRAAALPWPRSR
jgi:hypothetical protein